MRILVRGVGDIGSAVAVRHFEAGHAVAIHDGPQPTTPQRGTALADAVFDGRAILAGIVGVREVNASDLAEIIEQRECIAVAVDAFHAMLAVLAPDALVDARIRKRAVPEDQRGLARLVVGLGPNFVAWGNVHLAVATGGDDLGPVVTEVPTRRLAAEPRNRWGRAAALGVCARRGSLRNSTRNWRFRRGERGDRQRQRDGARRTAWRALARTNAERGACGGWNEGDRGGPSQGL